MVTPVNSFDSSLAIDANGLNALKKSANDNSPEAIKGVAKQFEAIFMNMMLKSMRDATPHESPFDNEQSRTFTSMLDQQLTQNLANKGIGLAEVLTRQLSKGAYSTTPDAVLPSGMPPKMGINSVINPDITAMVLQKKNNKSMLNSAIRAVSEAEQSMVDNVSEVTQHLTQAAAHKLNQLNTEFGAYAQNIGENLTNMTEQFKSRMSAFANSASRASGVPADFMLAQAALESGWGKSEIKNPDGSPSKNLFGIKASGGWTGRVIEARTSEFINGVKQSKVEKFRAYNSYEDAFRDFALMIKNSPRYEKVMENLHDVTAYTRAMQGAGFATDPLYAQKLASVIRKVRGA